MSAVANQSSPVDLHGRSAAVVGGATAGAEVAARLAALGASVVVFEQNPRPYGKIEDGLPRWHEKLRQKEFDLILGKLDHPQIAFVPNTKIGRDLPFEEVAQGFGFDVVILANGAWRDRPYPVPDAERFVDKGLIYQNPFVIAFNHADDPSYDGPRYPMLDNAAVVGGGLASIDVCKALMIETTRQALKDRGIEATMMELEMKGLPKILERHELDFGDLDLHGCTLFYQGNIDSMPIVSLPENADAARRDKVIASRHRLLGKAMEKYRFRITPCARPDKLLVENDRLVGLRMRETLTADDWSITSLEGTLDVSCSYVVSSIGSIPEEIPGIAMNGELYAFCDPVLGQLRDFPHVFSAGNVATGRGNIVASRQHGTLVAEHLAAAFLGVDGGHDGEEALAGGVDAALIERVDRIGQLLTAQTSPSGDGNALRAKVEARQQAVGYGGDLREWIDRVTPPGFA